MPEILYDFTKRRKVGVSQLLNAAAAVRRRHTDGPDSEFETERIIIESHVLVRNY
jgi:hypothetical protein